MERGHIFLACIITCSTGMLMATGCLESGDLLGGGSGLGGQGGPNINGGQGGAGNQEAPIDCPSFGTPTSVSLCAATYVDTSQADRLGNVAAAVDGQIVVAAALADASSLWGPDVRDGQASLLVFSRGGQDFERALSLGGDVGPLVATADGRRVIAAHGRRISAIDARSWELSWSLELPARVKRLSQGPSGPTTALQEDGAVALIDSSGAVVGQLSLDSPYPEASEEQINDATYDSQLELVHAVGSYLDPSGACGGRLPYLRSYDRSGKIVRSAYDFTDADGWCASSQGLRVVLGSDGKLYYAGQNQGGNTVHIRDPLDVGGTAPLVSYDEYNQGYGKAIEAYGFVARFQPSDLSMESGHLVLPRQDSVGGVFRIEEMRVDSGGRVAIVADTSCCLAGRDELTLSGRALGDYQQPETSLLLLSSDFSERLLWLSPTLESHAPVVPKGLDWRNGLLAMTSGFASPTELVTVEPFVAEPQGEAGGHLMTLVVPD